jgi:hypothetical protein
MLPQASVVQAVGQLDGSLGGLPLLGDDDESLPRADGGPRDVLDDVRGRRAGQVDAFVVLAVVDATGEGATEPLAPAVNDELAVEESLFAWCGRVADEDEVGLMSEGGECLGEARDACGKPADTRVAVGPFERNQDEDELACSRGSCSAVVYDLPPGEAWCALPRGRPGSKMYASFLGISGRKNRAHAGRHLVGGPF